MQILTSSQAQALIAFICARLTETSDTQLDPETAWHARACDGTPTGRFACACGVPARVLRDIAAKQSQVDDYAKYRRWYAQWASAGRRAQLHDEAAHDALERGCRLIASEHIDHPDYKPEWRLQDVTVRLTAEGL